jgi:parallel beta-helix repeat protein/predicted outer membrane repeat protein
MMKSRILLILAYFFLSFSMTKAQTAIPGGYVSGTWPAVNSPYLIQGDITIHADSSLTINPGVEVIFDGHHRFIINGIINAIGTEADSILFTATNPDTGWRGLRFMSSADTSHLDYCIVEYGRSTLGSNLHDRRGGGIYCNNSFPEISHCTIRNNLSEIMGGGIGFFSGDKPVLIKDCEIIGNTCQMGNGGGVFIQSNSNITIQNCYIRQNESSSSGGGVYFLNSSNNFTFHLVNCTVEENNSGAFGGGIFYTNGLSVTNGNMYITDCNINYNTASNGGGLYADLDQNSYVISGSTFRGNQVEGATGKGGAIFATGDIISSKIRYTTIDGNQAFEGGGVALYNGASADFENCTFVNNTGTTGGGTYYDSNSTVNIESSIFSSNSGSAIHTENAPWIVYCCNFYDNDVNMTGSVPGWFGALGSTNTNGDPCDAYYNIFLDPIFEDPDSGNYQITWDNWPTPDLTKSPCIDAGDPFGADTPDPDNTLKDIGAFYFNQIRPLISTSVSLLDFGIVDIGQSQELPLTILNTGVDSLFLSEINNISSLFTHNWNPDGNMILPGDSLLINITFAPEGSDLILDTLIIENNDKPVHVPLSGKGNIVVGIEERSELPKVYVLYPAYPNPFNSGITIEFDLLKQSFVTLRIYNFHGEEVSTLISKQIIPGRYRYVWNAGNMKSGTYLLVFTTGEFNEVRKIVLQK